MGVYYSGTGMGGGTGAGASTGGSFAWYQNLMAGLPGWLSTLITAVLLLLLAALVGWIVGRIVGGILYPNPEKQSLLNKKQKFRQEAEIKAS